MKSILLFVFIFLSTQQNLDINKLRKDTSLLKYKAMVEEINQNLLNKHFVIPKNYMSLQKEFIANPSRDFMKKRLKESGMQNADEYVDKLITQTQLMFAFMKNHPEISKLNIKDRTDLLIKLLND